MRICFVRSAALRRSPSVEPDFFRPAFAQPLRPTGVAGAAATPGPLVPVHEYLDA